MFGFASLLDLLGTNTLGEGVLWGLTGGLRVGGDLGGDLGGVGSLDVDGSGDGFGDGIVGGGSGLGGELSIGISDVVPVWINALRFRLIVPLFSIAILYDRGLLFIDCWTFP